MRIFAFLAFFFVWFIMYLPIFADKRELVITTDLRYPILGTFSYQTGFYMWLYTNDIFFFNVGYFPILASIYVASKIFDYYIVMKFLISIPMLLSMVAMFHLSKTILDKLKIKCNIITFLLMLASSFSYSLNPIGLLLYLNNTPMAFGYSVFPLSILLLIELFSKTKLNKGFLIYYVVLLNFLLIQFHSFIFYYIIPAVLIFLTLGFILGKEASFWKFSKRFVLMNAVSLLFLAYAWAPIIYVVAQSYYAKATPIYSVDESTIKWMFKDSNLLNDINLISYPWDNFKNVYFKYSLPIEVFNTIGLFSFIILLIYLFLFPKYDKQYKFFLVLSLLLLITGFSLSFLGMKFSTILPYGWILRDPTKVLPFIALSISIMITLAAVPGVSRDSRKIINASITKMVSFLVIFVIIILVTVRALPAFSTTIDFLKLYDKKRVEVVYQFLVNEKGYGSIAWFPVGFWERTYRDTIEMSTPFPKDVYSSLPKNQVDYLSFVYRQEDMIPYLNLIGVKYIGIDFDTPITAYHESLNKTYLLMLSKKDFRLCISSYNLTVFENLYAQDPFWIPVNVKFLRIENKSWTFVPDILEMISGVFDPANNIIALDSSKHGYETLVSPKIELSNQEILDNITIKGISSWVLSVWFNNDGKDFSDSAYIFIIKSLYSNDYFALGRNQQNKFFIEENDQILPLSIKPIVDKGWHNVILFYNSDTVEAYIDGYKLYSQKKENLEVFSNSRIYIGRSNPATLKYTGLVYISKLYFNKSYVKDIYYRELKENFVYNAKITSYQKINPSLWIVTINATKPFMLSFAEYYDPLWEARVYKNGKLLTKIRAVPLYGLINGFWIDATGDNLRIEIRYTPQDWFELGLVISGLTFFFYVFYLLLYLRSKNDK